MKNNKLLGILSTLVLLYLFSSTILAQTRTSIPAVDKQHFRSNDTSQGLNPREWEKIQKQINAVKYLPYSDKNGGYNSSNPAHGWKIHHATDGTTTIAPQNDKTKKYHLALKLKSLGYQHQQSLTNPKKISLQDNTVSYQWNENLREWWINSGQQLEQWFSVKHKPVGGSDDQKLTLQMMLNSTLKATQNGNNIDFYNSNGIHITYDKLKVWDTKGRNLPAQMKLASNNILSLQIDDSSATYPLTIDPSFQQQAHIEAPIAGNRFGSSVAISGDTLVVGDSANDDIYSENNIAYDAGAVYIYTRSGSTWVKQAFIKPHFVDGGDELGYSVAISGDTLVVGAPGEDGSSIGVNGNQSNNLANGTGAAYVFTRNGSSWIQQAYLKPSNPEAISGFGRAVTISGDTIVIGTEFEHSSGIGVNGSQTVDLDRGSSSGAAYVFTRNDSTWTQQAYLKASNAKSGGRFGGAVAIFNNTLVVGASGENGSSTGVNGDQTDYSYTPRAAYASGAAYVFTRNGATWTQQAYLKASNTNAFDYFGSSVAISGDTLVVGADGETSNATGVNGNQADNSAQSAGAAYVFTRNGSTWTQQAYLKASNTRVDSLASFGESVALSGNTLIIGSSSEDSYSTGVNGDQTNTSNSQGWGSGAAYIFSRHNSTWTQQDYLKASNAGDFDHFGESVAISGTSIAVGSFSKAAYIFTLAPTHLLPSNQWHQISLPMDPGSNDTVNAIFGDDDLGLYGTDWLVFRYDTVINNYIQLTSSDSLSQGIGYWIVQLNGSNRTLEMPDGSSTTPTTYPGSCSVGDLWDKSCFTTHLLSTKSGDSQMNMIGYPFGVSGLFSQSRILTNLSSSLCNNPSCSIDVANREGLFLNKMWYYDGVGPEYTEVQESDTLSPWQGYWSATLNNAHGKQPSLLFAK